MNMAETNHRWSPAELANIAGADDLKISPFRQDGLTYGTPTWIWHVALDELPIDNLSTAPNTGFVLNGNLLAKASLLVYSKR